MALVCVNCEIQQIAMEYSIKGREKKVKKVFYAVLLKFILFRLYTPLISKQTKERKLKKLHEITASKISNTFMDLEGLFLKLAQQISTLSNLLPEPYIKEFEKAQNHSKSRPAHQIKQQIESELGIKTSQIFSSFEEQPIGTASIGQVHKAQLQNGDLVAVKTQHLRIDEIAELDLQLIKKHIKIIKYFIKIPGFDEMFQEIVKMIHEELDYEHEAKQIQKIANNFKGDDRIKIPKVYEQYSTKKVLVMEYVEGEKITNHTFAQQNTLDQSQLAKNILHLFSKSIFIHGIYHADPHPGNLLVNKSGQIILIDFGAIGTLSKNMKEGLIILMQASILKDENLMISGFKKMGFISSTPGIHKISKKIIRLVNNYLVNELKIENLNLNEIDIEQINFSKIFGLIKELNLKEIEEVIKIPKDWVLLNRTIALTIATVGEIAPKVDVYQEVKPNLLKMAIQKENMGMLFKTTLQQQLLRIIALPRKIELFIEQAEAGELEVTQKNRKTEIKIVYALIQQILFAVAALYCYNIYLKSQDKAMFYISIIGSVLFLKSFITAIVLKRKIR